MAAWLGGTTAAQCSQRRCDRHVTPSDILLRISIPLLRNAGQISGGVGSAGYPAKRYAREHQAGQAGPEGAPRHEKRALKLGLMIDGHRRIVDEQPSSRVSRRSARKRSSLLLMLAPARGPAATRCCWPLNCDGIRPPKSLRCTRSSMRQTRVVLSAAFMPPFSSGNSRFRVT